MTPDTTRCYLRNVILSCIFDELADDAMAIDVANRVEEAVTRLFAVKPCDIGGLDPRPENLLMSYKEMIAEHETDDKLEGSF